MYDEESSVLTCFFIKVMDNSTSGEISSINKNECGKPTWGYDISAVQILGLCLACTPIVNISVNVITMTCIIRAPKLKGNTRLFLCSLTVCNAMYGLVVLPFRIFSMLTAKLDGLIGKNDVFCDVGNSFDVMLRMSSLMHLSVLAFDRYISLCRPFSRGYWLKRKFNAIVLTGSWIIPVIMSFGVVLPRVHLRGIVTEYECLLQETKMCYYIANKSFALTTFLCFIILASFVLLCNKRTMSAVERRENVIFRLLQINTKRASFHRRYFGTKLARTIMLMASCFLFSWLPYFVISLTDPLTSYRVPTYIWLLVTWLGYANTISNPVLYLKSTGILSFRLQ